MSDLQIALIALGVALVVAVWLYNLWQEKKQRQRAEAMLPATPSDVLMADRNAKTEPGIAAPAAVAEAAVPQEPSFMDPDLPLEPETQALSGTTEVDFLLDVEEGEGENRTFAPVPDEWGDGRADCLLRMEFVAAVPVHVLWEEHRDWSSRIDKPIQWLGLDARSGRWRTLLPQDAGSVSQVAVALQLVDRLGAVSEATLAAFLDGTSRLAQRFVGLADTPVLATVLAKAQELDAFCASVDLQLSLHVLPGKAPQMSGALLKPLIDAGELKLEGERYVALDSDGAEAFALICRSATSFPAERVEAMDLVDLIYSIDVPRVAAGAQAFDRMIAFARQCAAALGGQLADAHRKPLPDATIATIRGRIDELQHRMAEKDIAAGSMRALRLFS
jgi:hypothetical protein